MIRPISLILSAFFFLATSTAQAQEQSIDDLIDSAFQPVTDIVSSLVFFTISFGDVSVPFIVLWLSGAAVGLSLYMGFINFRGFRQALRVVSGRYDNPNDPGEVTHFQALTAALSGTVGVGNIAGVAVAISIGGPGATFWMILAGLFGMTSKFTECTLGLHYREIDENGVVTGGPMEYLSKGLAKRNMAGLGKFLAAFSALMFVAGTLGSGALFQTNQATQQILNVTTPFISALDGNGWIIGLIIAGLAAAVVMGGIKSIARVTSKLVPTMAIIYITSALIILLMHASAIPEAFLAIFSGAFTGDGVAGGIVGVLIIGLQRASFSNEAGIGSASVAHSAAKTKEPVAEGLVALLEPFIDTVVVCTITALVIIVTGVYNVGEPEGITLTSMAFESVFGWFPYLLAVAVVLFAFSTSITWYYYGQRNFFYLFGDNRTSDSIYKGLFLGFIIIGSSLALGSVVGFADSVILGMGFPNILGLIILAPEVKKLMKDYMARVKSGEIKAYKESKKTIS